MEKHLFLGDEAVAQAAIDAGLSVFTPIRGPLRPR